MPRPTLLAITFTALALALSSPATAQDAAAGREVAQRACSSCHAVAGPATNDAAPAFENVARDPSKTRAYLTAWLMNPHPPMPNLSLTVKEIADLVAYLESLRVTAQ